MLRRTTLAVSLTAVGLLAAAWRLPAQEPAAPTPADQPAPAATAPPAAQQGWTAWQIMNAGGTVGLVIIILSIAAGALSVEFLFTLRASVLMPPGLAQDVRELVAAGRLAQAEQRCRREPSFLSHVVSTGLAEVDGGWPAVEKAMEDATADQTARIVRRVEYLNVIANIAPMLGLLGTVMGMIMAFRQVAETQGAARAADLAEGIYLALVTTVEGLVVAIPVLGVLAFFRNRVDQLVAEVTYAAEHTLAPLKRGRPPAPVTAPAAPPASVAPSRVAPVPAPPPVGGK